MTSAVKVRTVPSMVQVGGITLMASPACSRVMDSTAVSTGFLLRLTMVWKAWMSCAATTTGSTPRCGMAACAPTPFTVTLNVLPPAITGPGLKAMAPAGRPGQLCMPKTASTGN